MERPNQESGAQPKQPMYALPQKRAAFQCPQFSALSIQVFGIPGSGETQFMGGDPNAIFASTEPGQGFMAARVVNIRSWAGEEYEVNEQDGSVTMSFRRLVHTIAAEKKNKTLDTSAVVIDITDNLHAMCQDFVCATEQIAHPSDGKYGKAWSKVTKEWTVWLRALMDKVTVRFITHCRASEIEVVNEHGLAEEITRYEPTFSGNKAAQYLDGVLNAVGMMTKTRENKYAITFVQDARTAAKDRTGILVKLGTIVLPDTPSQGFNHVSKLYADKAKELGFNVI